MQIEDEVFDCINIGAMDVERLLPEAKERSKEKALLNKDYWTMCKQHVSEGNVHEEYGIYDERLCWKNRAYVPEGLMKRVM